MLDQPVLVAVHMHRPPSRRELLRAASALKRCVLLLILSAGGPTFELLLPTPSGDLLDDLRLWVTPDGEESWLVGVGAARARSPIFKFVPDGLEAHWQRPWRNEHDRLLGHRHADLVFARFLAAFL